MSEVRKGIWGLDGDFPLTNHEFDQAPKPHALPPDVAPINEVRNQALEEAARTAQIVLRDFWPHGKNVSDAILALKRKDAGDDQGS